MEHQILSKPMWKRLGFEHAPDPVSSGKDIGIVVLDSIRPHAALRHLGRRIIHVIVNDDLSITRRDITLEAPRDRDGNHGEHGLMSVLLLSHVPFILDGHEYVGLAPAANYIVLDRGAWRAGEAKRLKRGMEWVLQRRDEWNVRIVNLMGCWEDAESPGWLGNTDDSPLVQALRPTLEAGLLMVASNGNTRLGNGLPPAEYFAVGSYLDDPLLGAATRSTYPDEPWGRNGDGHLRPDILAPRMYQPIPYCEVNAVSGRLSYFGQTSGTCTLVAGICAHILSLHPKLDPDTLRQALVEWGDGLEGYENPAPAVNVARTLHALADGYIPAKRLCFPPILRVTRPEFAIHSDDPIERGLALTIQAKQGLCSRADLWRFAEDVASEVRKVAVYALQKPVDSIERQSFWEHLAAENEGGVRGWWAYGLLQETQKDELDLWIRWVKDTNWSVRWCVSEFLKKYPEFPTLEKTHDPTLIETMAGPVLEWHTHYKKEFRETLSNHNCDTP
jgi:serine protease AprX